MSPRRRRFLINYGGLIGVLIIATVLFTISAFLSSAAKSTLDQYYPGLNINVTKASLTAQDALSRRAQHLSDLGHSFLTAGELALIVGVLSWIGAHLLVISERQRRRYARERRNSSRAS